MQTFYFVFEIDLVEPDFVLKFDFKCACDSMETAQSFILKNNTDTYKKAIFIGNRETLENDHYNESAINRLNISWIIEDNNILTIPQLVMNELTK